MCDRDPSSPREARTRQRNEFTGTMVPSLTQNALSKEAHAT